MTIIASISISLNSTIQRRLTLDLITSAMPSTWQIYNAKPTSRSSLEALTNLRLSKNVHMVLLSPRFVTPANLQITSGDDVLV
jgi:hypothetical protein